MFVPHSAQAAVKRATTAPAAALDKSAPEIILVGVDSELAGRGVQTASMPPLPQRAKPAGPQAALPKPHNLKADSVPPRDTLFQGGFGHAADYSWLTGELQHIRARNVWRLRYAPPDQEDRHGGAVLLVGDTLPSGCQGGQIVRVEGQLVNPGSDESRPPYVVRSLQVLKEAPVMEE